MDPHKNLVPLQYGPYTITKVAVGENDFKLSIPPFLGFHLVFNANLLRPYFFPLLDTSKVAEKLAPMELNHDFLEQDRVDQIMGTNIKGTCYQNIQFYRVNKVGKLH